MDNTGVAIIDEDDGKDKERFRRFLERWRAERNGFSSSISDIIACPSYLRIN